MNITTATPLVDIPTSAPRYPSNANGSGRQRETANIPEARPTTEGNPVASQKLAALLEEANEKLRGGFNVQFAVHEGSNRVVVRLVDPQSMKVIREFPNTELLDVLAKLQELSGLNVDTMT